VLRVTPTIATNRADGSGAWVVGEGGDGGVSNSPCPLAVGAGGVGDGAGRGGGSADGWDVKLGVGADGSFVVIGVAEAIEVAGAAAADCAEDAAGSEGVAAGAGFKKAT
jgi:hypothetical protein